MVNNEEYIIEELGIADWDAEKREAAVVEATMRIGNTLVDSLTEQQYNEYQAIINDDQAVISAWLSQNVPDYKDNLVYQEIADNYEQDPEHNNPEKIFANLTWIQQTIPDLQERIAQTLAAYKEELAR